MVPSMSRPANPYDNASCESFMKTLKREEIYANKYEDLENLRANIEEFIEQYYNRQRLHSALGYRSPEEFEQKTASQAESRSATMEFFENKENNKRILKDCWGRGLKCRPLPQTPSPARRCKNAFTKAEAVSKKNCAILGVHPLALGTTYVQSRGEEGRVLVPKRHQIKHLGFLLRWFGTRRSMVQIHSPRPLQIPAFHWFTPHRPARAQR